MTVSHIIAHTAHVSFVDGGIMSEFLDDLVKHNAKNLPTKSM